MQPNKHIHELTEIEIAHLDLRYADTRVHKPENVSSLMHSIQRSGQIVPVATLMEKPSSFVLMDGYLRVSGKLVLIDALPDDVLEIIRNGKISTWAASRVIAPIARAIPAHARMLTENLDREYISTRDLATFFRHYQKSNRTKREKMVKEPALFIKALHCAEQENQTSSPYEEIKPIILELFKPCRSNVVRISEILQEKYGCVIPYSSLTRIVRDLGLRENKSKHRAGDYSFAPGEECQHDTSPHNLIIGEKKVKAQCAGLVLAYSRKLFIRYYPSFTRFEAKVFLTEACRFMDGTCPRCIIDNTSVIVANGSGPDADISPEMECFGDIFGMKFVPHRIGDADRKAKIERNFFYVEKNFLPGRTFSDWHDLNEQATKWCIEKANQKPKRSMGMSPDAAYLMEKPYLNPLPPYIPPVYKSFYRVVDVAGYVAVDTNRYSVPERFLGKQVEVHKSWEHVTVFFKNQKIAQHQRIMDKHNTRVTAKGHHRPFSRYRSHNGPSKEEKTLTGQYDILDQYVRELKKRSSGRGVRRMRRLLDQELSRAEKNGTPVSEVIYRILMEEHAYRQERSLNYRLKQASIPWDRTLKTFPFDKQPGVNRAQLLELAHLSFIDRVENIVFIGNPGTGKSGLAIGLLRQALISGYRGRFYNAQDLLDELYASLADHTTPKLINRLCRYDLLVIDELGYLTLKPEQVNAFFKLMGERYGKKSTIITTNLDYPEWYDLFKRKSLVEALLDRLKHHCITITINGPSLRIPDVEEKPDKLT